MGQRKMATMANICLRSIFRNSQVISSRGLASSAGLRKKYEMNGPLEHATGVEKWELLKQKEGVDDPFFMKMRTRGKGTKEEPNIVDAMDTFRIVGCHCNAEDTTIKYFWLHEGKPSKCQLWLLVPIESTCCTPETPSPCLDQLKL